MRNIPFIRKYFLRRDLVADREELDEFKRMSWSVNQGTRPLRDRQAVIRELEEKLAKRF